MPTLIRILTPQGLVPADYQAETLAEASAHEPHDGIYTVANTFHATQTLKLNAHLDRMERSAALAHIPLVLDRPRLRAALRAMIIEAGWGDVRFRVTVPRATPERFILSLEPFKPLSTAFVQAGVRAISAANAARHNPEAKSTDWMHDRDALQRAMPAGIYDTFLCDAHGHLLEGLGSNFYAIIDGELWTAGTGVLQGIAQQIILEVAPAILPVRMQAPHLNDLPRFSEAFLSSSSRGPVPVVELDGQRISDGMGPQTARLHAAYWGWAQAHLEEL